MNQEIFSKFIAAVLLATLIGWAVHADQANRAKAGREAFIAKETLRWDQHYANPDSITTDLIVALLACGVLFSLYEVFAFGVLLIVKRINVDNQKRQTP
jgi:hypothetical protein